MSVDTDLNVTAASTGRWYTDVCTELKVYTEVDLLSRLERYIHLYTVYDIKCTSQNNCYEEGGLARSRLERYIHSYFKVHLYT